MGRFQQIPILGKLDPFILGILCALLIAAIFPATGVAADVVSVATKIAVAALFFLYGARLSTKEALQGLRHWRLHGAVFAATFVLFPLIGVAAKALTPWALPTDLYTGLLFLTLLPSTVQSSIAFTGIARGNVAAAIVSASFSNFIGVFITPLLVAVLMTTSDGGFQPGTLLDIVYQLLLPFILGQVLRRWIGGWVSRHNGVLKYFDRGSILLVVYSAFSEGMREHIWSTVSFSAILVLIVVCCVILAIVLTVTWYGAKAMGFSVEDQITILFCGSKKSLATGAPMAAVLFAGQGVGLIVLPVILFHQIQLITCSVIAGRLAKRPADPRPSGGSS